MLDFKKYPFSHITNVKIQLQRKGIIFMKTKKMQDFGAKIGGAKKDIWSSFHLLTEEEKKQMAKKDIIWPRPDYLRQNHEDGIEPSVLFWKNEMRKALKPHPDIVLGSCDSEGYVKLALEFKKDVEGVSTLEDIEEFYQFNLGKYLQRSGYGCRTWKYRKETYSQFLHGNKILRFYHRTKDKVQSLYAKSGFLKSWEEMEREKYKTKILENVKITQIESFGEYKKVNIQTEMFGHIYSFPKEATLSGMDSKTPCMLTYNGRVQDIFPSEASAEAYVDEKIASCLERKEEEKQQKKEKFIPPQLEAIERTGSDYRFIRIGDGNILSTRFGLRGGEFGNYMSSKDRSASVNMAYDALEDLSDALGIDEKDVSLGEQLAIAFGARGAGSAVAHYEPVKNVINLTKKRGAGSLAHEWGHALDRYVGNTFGFARLATQVESSECFPDSFNELVASMKTQNRKNTRFLEESIRFDGKYAKDGNGYWSSTHEMFARAFACYIKDKLEAEGRRSDYLVGHADSARCGKLRAYPVGEERECINEKFDAFFADMKEQGFLHQKEKEPERKNEPKVEVNPDILFYQSSDGQLCFC